MYRIMTDNLLIEKENCLLLQITRPRGYIYNIGSKFKKIIRKMSAKLFY